MDIEGELGNLLLERMRIEIIADNFSKNHFGQW